MTGSDSERRVVIASQTCEPKGWAGENGREECWKSLGGLAAEWANPIDEAKWFDKDNRSDELCEKTESARLLLSARGWGGGRRGRFRPRWGIYQGCGEAGDYWAVGRRN